MGTETDSSVACGPGRRNCLWCHLNRSLRLLLGRPKIAVAAATTIAIRMLLGPCFRYYRNSKRSLLRGTSRTVQIVCQGDRRSYVRGPYEPYFNETVPHSPNTELVLDPDWSTELVLGGRSEERYVKELSKGSAVTATILLFVVMLVMFASLLKMDVAPVPTNQTMLPPSLEDKHTVHPLAFSNLVVRGGY